MSEVKKPRPFPELDGKIRLQTKFSPSELEDAFNKLREYDIEVCKWREEFVAWLQSLELPAILDAMTELVDDRSDFQKGYKKGYVDCLEKVLEVFK